MSYCLRFCVHFASRTMMVEHGLVVDGGDKSRARELEDIRTKTQYTDLLRFLMDRLDCPHAGR